MNEDGTLVNKAPWFGRTVIKSCCKLDYGTAQDMVDRKVDMSNLNDAQPEGAERSPLWEHSRRPMQDSGQNCADVIKDVRLMHKIAMNRRYVCVCVCCSFYKYQYKYKNVYMACVHSFARSFVQPANLHSFPFR
jgi:hypothetical protein